MRCLRSLAPFGTPDASSVSRRLGAASTSEPCLPNHASASSEQPLKATALHLFAARPSVHRSAASHRISQPQRTRNSLRQTLQAPANDQRHSTNTNKFQRSRDSAHHNARSTTRPALHRPIMAPAPYETAYLKGLPPCWSRQPLTSSAALPIATPRNNDCPLTLPIPVERWLHCAARFRRMFQ